MSLPRLTSKAEHTPQSDDPPQPVPPPVHTSASVGFPKRSNRNHSSSSHTTRTEDHPTTQSKHDAKETAALRRNVESLTKVSRQDAKTIQSLKKDVKMIREQLRLSKAETLAALEVSIKVSSTQQADSAATERINVLNNRIRELQHDLTLSQRNEQEAQRDLAREKEQKRSHVQVRRLPGNDGSVGGSSNKLQQQLNQVSAHAKSLLVQNKQLEQDVAALRAAADARRAADDRTSATEAALEEEKRLKEELERTIEVERGELVATRQQLAKAQQRRQQHASDLSRTTQELLKLKNETIMMQRRMHEAERASRLLQERDTEIASLKRAVSDMQSEISGRGDEKSGLDEERRRWEEDRRSLEKMTLFMRDLERETDSLRRTNQGLAQGLTKYKNAVDELHPQAMRLKVAERDNDRLTAEIQRLTELQSSDFLILTTEMERLRSKVNGNEENEEFSRHLRMELDDAMLNAAEVRNNHLRLLDQISGLKRAQQHLQQEMNIQDQVLRDAEIRSTTAAKQLEGTKNELSGALRLQNALEDECDDAKRSVRYDFSQFFVLVLIFECYDLVFCVFCFVPLYVHTHDCHCHCHCLTDTMFLLSVVSLFISFPFFYTIILSITGETIGKRYD